MGKRKGSNRRRTNRSRRGLRAGTAIRKVQYSGDLKENSTVALNIAVRANVTFRVQSVRAIVMSSKPTLVSAAIRGVGSEDEKVSAIRLCNVTPCKLFVKQGRGVEAVVINSSASQHVGWLRNHGSTELKYLVDVVYTLWDFEPTVSRNKLCDRNLSVHCYDSPEGEETEYESAEDDLE